MRKKSETSVAVEGLRVISDRVELLARTSWAAQFGDVVVIRGGNGSGKTTLLRVLAGACLPSEGTVFIAGTDMRRRGRQFRKRVAVMIGLTPMARDLTLHDHIAIVAATWYATREERALVVESQLSRFALKPLASRFPHELSSGQLQMLGLALVLARPFEVLLLDEPEQRLDAGHLSLLINILASVRAQGKTVVVATHNDTLADELGDVIVQLEFNK